MKKAASALLFSFLLFVPPAGAESFHWEFAGWEGGGCYPSVEFDPLVKDRVYLTSDVAGLWRSDDKGEHWRFINKGLGNLIVPLVAVAPSDSNVLYAGTSAGLFYSRNAGADWAAAAGKLSFIRPESHRSIAVSAKDPGRLAAGTSQGEVFYSEDFGAGWKLLGGKRPFKTARPITALAWAEEEGRLYASSAEGLAAYSFADSKWTLFKTSPKDITDILLSEGTPRVLRAAGQKKLFTSRDGGATWTAGGEVPKGKIYRLLVPNANEETILAAWNEDWKGGVVRSEDGGATWKSWDREMTPDAVSDPTRAWAGAHGRVNSLKQDPFDKNVLFRTDWWGVWRSDDGGVTWAEKINGAPNTVATDLALSAGGTLYVSAMDNGILKSTDGGKSYEPVFPAKGFADDVNGHAWRVLFSGQNLIATSSPWTLDRNQVVLSSDGGKNFEHHAKGLPSRKPVKNTVWEHGYARALAVHPGRPNTVYLGIDGDDGGGFFVSRDGGLSFKRSKNQPGSLKIYNGLAVDPKSGGRILWGASGKSAGIYISEDEGGHWRKAAGARMKNVFDVVFGPDGRAYAAGEDSGPMLYRSEDSGNSWKKFKRFEGDGGVKGLCILPDGRIVAGVTRWHGNAPGHIYLGSVDGKVWEKIDGDLPDGTGPASFAFNPERNTLYMARFAGSVYKTRIGDGPHE